MKKKRQKRKSGTRHDLFWAVVDKLDETGFFLSKVEGSVVPETRYFTSAFASACYSLRQCLEKACDATPEAKAWWASTKAELYSDPTAKFFNQSRNDDVHQGYPLVDGFSFSVSFPENRVSEESLLRKTSEDESEDKRKLPAEECQRYFRLLVRKCVEGYGLFKESWDGNSRLSQWMKQWTPENDLADVVRFHDFRKPS